MEGIVSRIRRINARRQRRAVMGPPGDPPAMICEVCGLEECAIECGKEDR